MFCYEHPNPENKKLDVWMQDLKIEYHFISIIGLKQYRLVLK